MTDLSMWQAADMPLPPGLLVGCTVTTGGVSSGAYAQSNMALHVGDDTSAVEQNRSHLKRLLGYQRVQWLDQVHSNRCVQAPSANAEVLPEADASWTTQPGLALAVLTADCVPILLWSEHAAAIAAVHAGWRGLHSEILQHAIVSMRQPASQLCAWIGPSISAEHYEVGEDVWSYFKDDFGACLRRHPDQANKRLLDLPGIAQAQLNRAGVEQVYQSGWCSFTDQRFYSFRRDGMTGRMASMIAWLE